MTPNDRVTANLKLVHHVALKYANGANLAHLQYDDLFQIGCIGLIKASRYFDESRNVQFATYAVPMIRGQINNYLTRRKTIVKVPRKDYEVLRQIKLHGLIDQSPAEISEALGVPEKHAKQALEYAECRTISIETAVGLDGEKRIVIDDLLPSIQDYSHVVVDDFLRVLTERERMTLVLRAEGKTQREIADGMNVSQTQIHRDLKRIGKKWHDYCGEVNAC